MKTSYKKIILSLILGILVSFFGTPLVNNSKPIYKTSIKIGTPDSLPFQQNYYMLKYVADYNFNFNRFLISVNDEILKNNNPCNSVSVYQNKPSIVIVGQNEKIFIEMISEDKLQMDKCSKFIDDFAKRYELSQKKFINDVILFKYGKNENESRSVDEQVKNLMENFKSARKIFKDNFEDQLIKNDLNIKDYNQSLKYAFTLNIMSILENYNRNSKVTFNFIPNIDELTLVKFVDVKTEILQKYSKNLIFPSLFLISFFISLFVLNFNSFINLLRKIKLN